MKEKLTLLEAYKAMYAYLQNYYVQMDKPDEIGALLGDLRLLHDGNPVDRAAWTDWLDAVKKACPEEGDAA
jgi:hypothetical protein